MPIANAQILLCIFLKEVDLRMTLHRNPRYPLAVVVLPGWGAVADVGTVAQRWVHEQAPRQSLHSVVSDLQHASRVGMGVRVHVLVLVHMSVLVHVSVLSRVAVLWEE